MDRRGVRFMRFAVQFLAALFMGLLLTTAGIARERGDDFPALLDGRTDPETVDVVGLRFGPHAASFALLKAQAEQQYRERFLSVQRGQLLDVRSAARDIRLLAWLNFVNECSDENTCRDRVGTLRRQLQAFRALRERLAAGDISEADEQQFGMSSAPVLERALAIDPMARKLLSRAVRAGLTLPDNLEAFLEYEQQDEVTANAQWLRTVLEHEAWLHFSDEQLGLTAGFQRSAPVQAIMARRTVAAVQFNRMQVDLALWVMFREIPDAAFQRAALSRALPFVQRGESDNRFYSTMADRLAVDAGDPQIYGTQGRCNAAREYELYPIADPSHVDARRAEIGLEALATVLPEQRRMAGPCMTN